jgi:hypothetical protein
MRRESHIIQCPKCGESFDETGGWKLPAPLECGS